MILLLSRQDDGSTRDVAEWLYAMHKKFIRINADDRKNRLMSCDIENDQFSIKINSKPYTFSAKEIKSVWHRRSGFAKDSLMPVENKPEIIFHEASPFARKHLREEATEIFEYIYDVLETNTGIRNIGSPSHNAVNKLIVLKMAKSCGLQVPQSYIISEKKELSILLRKEKNLVTKAIGNGVYRFTEEYGYYSYTEKITKQFVNALPETFFPSLVQKEIDKKYELRIFYLEGKFYSMAIFSQESAATTIDNRKNYAAQFMPRRVPHLLPKIIEKRLSLLMRKLKLNTGSIDMLVAKSNEYYFLEVNPIGQFGMVSQPCNYYLEKKIAEAL